MDNKLLAERLQYKDVSDPDYKGPYILIGTLFSFTPPLYPSLKHLWWDCAGAGIDFLDRILFSETTLLQDLLAKDDTLQR